MSLPRVLVLLVLLAPAAAFAACGGDGGDEQPSPTEPAAGGGEVEIEDLVASVVQLQALDSSGEVLWTGSGTIISSDGLVLTNAHVVEDPADEYDQLGVAVSERTDEPAELRYLAEVLAVDHALDLAVVRIAETIDGEPVDQEFPFVRIGDSDSVEIGDEIRILGYPGIGGDTITLTRGAVSGFTSERGVGGRAWIKTDATIAGGNSGGLAVNERGELIGVPTIVGSGAQTDSVDCRYVADTNRDGVVDENDNCVPVGGFINGLRPVALAAPLIAAAEAGETYVSRFDAGDTAPTAFPTDDVILSNLIFAAGVTEDDEPVDVRDAMPSGTTRICGFWDYEGMQNGMEWEALWFINGELSEDGSIVDEQWVGGEEGNWWVCIVDEENGLQDGLYELIISVEGDYQGSRAIFVGGDHPPVELEIVNESSEFVCYVFISPSGAQNWGFDQLGVDEGIGSGESRVFELPGGMYDLLIEDCDARTLIDERNLDLTEGGVYTLTD
jgi:S1-C subfamily serine protease